MQLKQTLIIAVILGIVTVTAWELYWRSEGYYPTLNDDKALWALHRADVETADHNDFIILGSSRAYFDIQINEFEKSTGKKPIQLSSTGSSPLPAFHDIVNNTNFNGTIILGVTPGLFFSTTYSGAMPWSRVQSKIDYYEDQTYAQKINFNLSIPLQSSLVLMSADEEEWATDIDLKSLLRRIHIGNRISGSGMPPFNNFGDVSIDRNMRMIGRTVTDTAFANSIVKVWHFFGKSSPPPDKESTMSFFMEDLKKFKARNGNLILIRPPSSGGVRMGENMALPRTTFWDDLVKQAEVKSYHFEDYEELKNLTCPEESHLSKQDAEYFTNTLVNIMKADGALSNSKTN
jgi:hypothetical protein